MVRVVLWVAVVVLVVVVVVLVNKGNGLFHIIQIDRFTSSFVYVCSSCLYDCFLGFLHFLLCRFLHFLFYSWVLNW